ncbi:MAG TPA: ATP-binding cassette domain-containing protein, partial [Acidilobales archaeon]|nr:ATP-binding cassette domain-containing protein [Acidilobales archaeon]
KLLLLDEPTSHLDPGNAIKVINGVLKLKRLGKSLIIIDHYIERWRSVVDEILFLTNGTLTDINGVKDPYVKWRALIKSLRPPEDVGEVICDVSIKSFSYPGSDFEVLKDVVFEVRRGEIVWVKGPSGCGKTTLLRLIAKKFRSREGYVRVHGKTIYVPDNPLLYFSEPTPEAEVLGRLDILSKFGLKELSRTPIMKLSTGERRRLAIASILARKFDLALLDEPTIGLDPKSKYEVLKSIVSLAGEGVAVIISSHDEDLRFISSWVYELG